MQTFYDKDQVVDILKEFNIRITPNRLKVAQIILNSKKHPSIDEVHTELIKSNKNISFTSVYNIIKMFQSAHLVMEIKAKDRSRYDPNTNPHSHFVCMNCGRVFDVEDNYCLDDIPKTISGMKVYNIELTYNGICMECEE